jgi:hypothetical protein
MKDDSSMILSSPNLHVHEPAQNSSTQSMVLVLWLVDSPVPSYEVSMFTGAYEDAISVVGSRVGV